MLTKYVTVGGPVVPGLCTVAREWYPVDTGKREDEGQDWSCFIRMLAHSTWALIELSTDKGIWA